MNKTEKEQVIADLATRLRASESLIVADYRGLTNSQLVGLRTKLRESGAKFQVVKNTLTRRAAEEAGADALLALLEGPTAIAFVETDGDPIAVAKALADVAKESKILTLRGGVLSGRALSGEDVDELAKLPTEDVVKSQLVGVIIAPLTQLLGLLEAPVRDLVGVLDARIEQLGGSGAEVAEEQAVTEASEEQTSAVAEIEAEEAPADQADAEPEADEPMATAEADATEAPADKAASEETDDTDTTDSE